MSNYDDYIPESAICKEKYFIPNNQNLNLSQNKSFYPLNLSNTFSKEFKLYLQYKGIESPSDKMNEAFKNANVELPR